MEKNIQSWIEDLEETILRLHTYLRSLEEGHNQFRGVKKFLAKTGIKRYNEKLQKEMKEFNTYTWYKAKFYAYYFVLENFGSNVIPVLKRLRGVEMTSSTVLEKKMHYTEIAGHFDTDEYLGSKKNENTKKN